MYRAVDKTIKGPDQEVAFIVWSVWHSVELFHYKTVVLQRNAHQSAARRAEIKGETCRILAAGRVLFHSFHRYRSAMRSFTPESLNIAFDLSVIFESVTTRSTLFSGHMMMLFLEVNLELSASTMSFSLWLMNFCSA